jgi:adenosine deaminase
MNNVELHIHLEGCVWDKHIQRWIQNASFLFPPPKMNYSDHFDKFLAHLRFRYNFINTLEAYLLVFRDFLSYCVDNEISYSEIQINKALLNTWNIDLVKLLTEFNAEKVKYQDLTINYIIDVPYQFPISIVSDVIANTPLFKKMDVVAIGFGGDERFADLEDLKSFVDDIKKSGLKILCHLGETEDPMAKEIVKCLEPDRIAHGIHIMDWLIDNYLPENGYDFCLTSNIDLKVVEKLTSHPISKIQELDVPFTISSDDPAMFNTTLKDEIDLAVNEIIEFDLNKMRKNAIKCVFDKEGYLRATGIGNF